MHEIVASRRSIRKYTDEPVDEATVDALLESARLAPSGNNTQPWHFIVVRDPAIRKALATASHDQQWMLTAPVFIACVADIRARITGDAPLQIDELSPRFEVKQIIRDTSIAIEHIVLEAADRGLGTCWIAWFGQQEIRPILGIPSDKFLVAILTVGHPAEEPKPKSRKRLDQIVHRERW
jgi:nitroreductase